MEQTDSFLLLAVARTHLRDVGTPVRVEPLRDLSHLGWEYEVYEYLWQWPLSPPTYYIRWIPLLLGLYHYLIGNFVQSQDLQELDSGLTTHVSDSTLVFRTLLLPETSSSSFLLYFIRVLMSKGYIYIILCFPLYGFTLINILDHYVVILCMVL